MKVVNYCIEENTFSEVEDGEAKEGGRSELSGMQMRP